jgi:uncharacterized lipoprotein
MKRLIVLLLCLGLYGCATVKPITAEDRQHIYNADFNTVWSKSIEMLTQENFPIKSMDKSSGLIQTDYCKNQIKHSWMSMGRYSLNLFVSSIDDTHTKVIINPSYEISIPGNIYATGYGPGMTAGRWQANDSKDKMLTDKYFKILDVKLKI